MSLTTRLFVGNLPSDTNEVELRSAFAKYGKLVNLDLKSKPDVDQIMKLFAFVTLSSSNYEVESCIKDFANNDFNGNKLYVTRARESFLERLQRERQEAQNKNSQAQVQKVPEPVLEFNPRKRKLSSPRTSPVKDVNHMKKNTTKNTEKVHEKIKKTISVPEKLTNGIPNKEDKKKIDSDKKRLESLKRKRQDFKEKQNIIKSGLVGIDKVQNKKIKFSNDDEPMVDNLNTEFKNKSITKSQALFDDDDEESDGDVNFNVKEQYEGKEGQKFLDLQSRYKSDKRFVLDERFIEDENVERNEESNENERQNEAETIDPGTADEKTKQLSILQDVLGVAVTSRTQEQSNKKTKTRMGMLRFDPLQPGHAKHLAPVDETKQEVKKSKKKKNKEKQVEEETSVPLVEENKVEVSKEQFYKVSENLKEVIEQPATFSLRSLFSKDIEETSNNIEQDGEYIPLESKEKKRKNPLEPGVKNPFVYDSSESEAEDDKQEDNIQLLPQNGIKAVWKENFFFAVDDDRFTEALKFFNSNDNRENKERRELKSLMKKRIYNKERKNQMFQKKIGGRKKTMKKSYRKK